MNKLQISALATALLLISAGAYAGGCPKYMKQIDDALAAEPELSATDMAEVKKLRGEGEMLHKTGKHQESVDALTKAIALLGTQ